VRSACAEKIESLIDGVTSECMFNMRGRRIDNSPWQLYTKEELSTLDKHYAQEMLVIRVFCVSVQNTITVKERRAKDFQQNILLQNQNDNTTEPIQSPGDLNANILDNPIVHRADHAIHVLLHPGQVMVQESA
jgi:hypothetical protein